MKRFIGVLGIAALAVVAVAASATAAPAPKATGDYGYSYAGVQRHVKFNAIQANTNTCGTFWNVTNPTQFAFRLTGDTTDYVHHVDLTQTGQNITGGGGYPVAGGDQYHWTVTSGSLVGNELKLTVEYDLGATGTVMHINGTIANGIISGTWDDDFGGARTGAFTSAPGAATSVASYCGKGTFSYDDAQGYWYFGVVKTVSVSGSNAWYAVQILASNLGFESSTNNYLFVKVTDNGEPGTKDVTGGDLMTAAGATSAVAGKLTPTSSVTINAGNIQVH
jgi:hypothetical protein